MFETRMRRDAIKLEIAEFLSSNPNIDLKKLKKAELWYHPKGENLRFNDIGFELYSMVKSPFSIATNEVMISNRMMQLLVIMRDTPWYYVKKYTRSVSNGRPPVVHTFWHWDEGKNVSWVLSGENWDLWAKLNQ